MRRGLVLSDGDLVPFFTRPISLFLFLLIVAVVLFRMQSVRRLFARLRGGERPVVS